MSNARQGVHFAGRIREPCVSNGHNVDTVSLRRHADRTTTQTLRAIQEQEFERLGSPHTTRVDVRMVAAINRNLEQMATDRRRPFCVSVHTAGRTSAFRRRARACAAGYITAISKCQAAAPPLCCCGSLLDGALNRVRSTAATSAASFSAGRGLVAIERSSARISPSSQGIVVRSSTLRSSRTLPGQS
jgi:hypothetical protein